MVRAITLLLLISPLSFAGDNSTTIITKGTNNQITTKQVGNGNITYILCGANSSGTITGASYSAHSCTNAVWSSTVEGNSNIVKMYTVWSNNIGNSSTVNIDGNDNYAYIDQDEDDNTVTITQTGNDNHAEALGSGDDNVYSTTQTGNNKYSKIFYFGDDSDITVNQYGTGQHNSYIYGNGGAHNNSINVTQYGSGNKDADIFFYNSDNEVDLTQYGTGAHVADMKFYTTGYNVDVTQLGATNQSYTATFNCTADCTKTISITQQ